MTVLTLKHKDCMKILKEIKHNSTYKKALKKNGRCFFLKDEKKYMLEDINVLQKMFK